MAVLTPPKPKNISLPVSTPRKKRWTVDEFHELWEDGWFEQSRAILIDGEIIEMPIPNPPHVMTVTLAQEELGKAFPSGHVIRVQQPLPFGLWTEPIPDVAVVPGSARDYVAHPRTALLVVEASDSTLTIDTVEKPPLYAAAGIQDYWVVDINNRQLIVFRDPIIDPNDPTQSRYRTRQVFDAGATISPLAAPHVTIRVADLLP